MESGIADLERELVVTSAQISDVDHHLAALGNERNLLKGLERGLLERLASLKKGVTLQGGVPTAGSASTSAPSAKTQHDDTESDDELAYRAEQDRPAVRHAAPVVNAEPSPSPGAMHGRLPSTVPEQAGGGAGQPFPPPEEERHPRAAGRIPQHPANELAVTDQPGTTSTASPPPAATVASMQVMPPPAGKQLAAAAPRGTTTDQVTTSPRAGAQVKFAGRHSSGERRPVPMTQNAWGGAAVVPGGQTGPHQQQQPPQQPTSTAAGTRDPRRIMPGAGRSPGYDKSFPAAAAAAGAARLHGIPGAQPYSDRRMQPAPAVDERPRAEPISRGPAPSNRAVAAVQAGGANGSTGRVNTANTVSGPSVPYNLAAYNQHTWAGGAGPRMHAAMESQQPVYGGHHQPQHPALVRVPAGAYEGMCGPARFYPQHHLQHHGGTVPGGGMVHHVLPSGQILQSIPQSQHAQQMMASHQVVHPSTSAGRQQQQQQQHMAYSNGHHPVVYGGREGTMPLRHPASSPPRTLDGRGVRRKSALEPSVPRKARKQDRGSGAPGSLVQAKVKRAYQPRKKQAVHCDDADRDAVEVTKKEKARQFSRESRARKKAYIQSLEDLVAKVASANTATVAGTNGNGSAVGTAYKGMAWPGKQKHMVGEKPFACSYCSKRFTTLHRVTKHEKTHSDYDQDEEASYACSVCDRSFSWDTLAAHERTHHVHKKKPKVTVTQAYGPTDDSRDDDETEPEFDDDETEPDFDDDRDRGRSKPMPAKDYHAAQLLLEVQDSSHSTGNAVNNDQVRKDALFTDPVRQLGMISAKTIPGTTTAKIRQVKTINSMIMTDPQ